MFYPEVHIMSLTPPITIRPVSTADSQALLDIYRPYVEHTAITFEYEVPTAEEFTRRIRHTLKRYPYLAAEKDGQLLGYAYAGPFHERAAYDWCAEVSIYIRTDARGTGIGKNSMKLWSTHLLPRISSIFTPASHGRIRKMNILPETALISTAIWAMNWQECLKTAAINSTAGTV